MPSRSAAAAEVEKPEETEQPDQANASGPEAQSDEEPEKPKAHGSKAKKKTPAEMFGDFFGRGCESEINQDGHMVRGAETFAVTAPGEKAPGENWVALAESDHAVLYKKRD